MARDVFFRSLDGPVPVYHDHDSIWTGSPGCRGPWVTCNTFVHTDVWRFSSPSHVGIPLPAEVRAPCGIPVYARSTISERRPGLFGYDVLNSARMTEQGLFIPLRHAVKFGLPCHRCYRKGVPS